MIAAIGSAAFLHVASPGMDGGIIEPSPWTVIIPLAGLFGVAVGLAWMIRIAQSGRDPEER